MIKFGALWKPRNKDGKAVLTGSINQDARIIILPNNFKKLPAHPDYIIYLTESERKPGAHRVTDTPTEDQPKSSYPPPPPEDEVPF